jgi:hypothetical protein
MRLYPHDDVTGVDDWDTTHYELTDKANAVLNGKGK